MQGSTYLSLAQVDHEAVGGHGEVLGLALGKNSLGYRVDHKLEEAPEKCFY
jgi:hypothetical protein